MATADKGQDKKYKNRMGMFDFIKGVAIFIVVLVHVVGGLSENPFISKVTLGVVAISTVWMAVFFLASGYWFSPRNVKEYTRKALFPVLKQYVFVGIITTFCYVLVHYLRFHWVRGALQGSKGVILAYLLGSKGAVTIGTVSVYEIGPIWFLLALCVGSIFLNILMNMQGIQNKRLVVFILAALGVGLGYSLWLPYCISPMLGSMLCLYIGYEMRQSKYLISTWKPSVYVKLVILALVGKIMMGVGYVAFEYQEVTLQLVLGIPAGILMLRLCLMVDGLKNRIVRLFKHMGRYTLWILMVHTIEMQSIDWSQVTRTSFFKNHPLLGLLGVLAIRWAIIAIGCMIISKAGKFFSRRKFNESAE